MEACLEKVELPKGELLVREGRICRNIYFVEKGAMRGFYTLGGKEITHWFAFENDFVTSNHSFIREQPSVENIQLMEDAILWKLSKQDLQRLMNDHHDIERLVRMNYEKYYIRLEERFVNAHFKSASERYQDLLTETPHILERVPLGWIASYLGISQETLSRVRGKI
ncbi:MAG: Crp/Fnr family transcriptional regulator [Chitinophagaceae bacterium]|nr:MAG: Crp/Fnr family transcriptional regulator [Chitinophagaceae bacterium]